MSAVAAGRMPDGSAAGRVQHRAVWVYVAAFVAALLFALGSVVQQRAASTAPPEKALSFALLLWLVRRRVWLLGFVASVVGNGLAAAAIGGGGVALVQPLFTSRLLFALALSAVLSRVTVGRRDWIAALLTAGGLAAFVAVGQPGKGHPLDATTLQWAPAVAGVAVLVAALVAFSKRREVAGASLALAAAGGLLFGLQSSLTETSIAYLQRDGFGTFAHWQPWILIAAALYGAVLVQSAYEMAPLPASFPALVSVEPLTGLVIGVTVLHGTLDTSAGALFAEIAGLGVMVAGVALLARSPLVTGQLAALERRREEGIAYRTARELEELLGDTEASVGRAHASPVGRPGAGERGRHLRDADRQLERLGALLEAMDRHRMEEADQLRRLPPKQRYTLAPLEQELDERQARIEAWAERLRRERAQLG